MRIYRFIYAHIYVTQIEGDVDERCLLQRQTVGRTLMCETGKSALADWTGEEHRPMRDIPKDRKERERGLESRHERRIAGSGACARSGYAIFYILNLG